MKLTSIKTQVIVFLACFGLFLSIKDRDSLFLLTTFIAVTSSALIDSVLSYLKNKKFTISESSIISGLIIGYVLSSDQPWWMFLLASSLAMSSKYFIRFNKRHIFNPAAFGIFLTTILFGAETQWRGTYLWYILIPVGFYFTLKLKKLEVIIGYLATALLLFGTQAFIQKTPLLNIFGYLSYFYIFIMLIEPKTTPIKAQGKLLFGLGVAALIFIFTEAGVRFDVELASLLALNIFAPFLNKLPERSRK
jgi:Na+-translocating ferredoxin:NAD+ oxidoreductase RnfD subunit